MSAVWDHFTLKDDKDEEAECTICHNKVKRGGKAVRSFNTTNLIKHLGKYHHKQYKEYVKKTEDKKKGPTQLTLAETFAMRDRLALDSPKAQGITRVIAEEFILDEEPLSLVEADTDRCLLLELPDVLTTIILEEVVLQEGDRAIGTLALVCSTFRDLVSTEYFRRRAHFKWLNSVWTWSKVSADFRREYYNMYTVEICHECGEQFKQFPRGFVGTGKRGEITAFYSDEELPPGYCSRSCCPIH
ncbi:uncharacterized protein LOC130913794 [Corythoichthys intestinalis]|uniref:uncharacterized protein LOC130913794 n=1 Tax=Corythoichthys intestinalis TaxID=161448 RepID=UPI0025A4F723|nr:uncharacterized protein LOC130913794 [Corythoichthys intestinalis]